MKTDNYLNLCLEQAAKSPLRYRHGCIIVRGGKVIGQGFNDHRSGYDGGALKTGRLPARSLDTAALAELKKKRKLKRDLKNPNLEAVTTFTPFEAMSGGGKQANTPLSMHSEMMAIHSALSASRALVSMAVSSQKPYFKLSGDSKRKARLRRDAIKTYAKTICRFVAAQSTEQRAGQPQVQDWQSEDRAFQVPAEDSIEKHRTKNQRDHQHEQDDPVHDGQHSRRRQYARKLSVQQTAMAPCHSSSVSDFSENSSILGISAATDTRTRPSSKTPTNTDYIKKRNRSAPPSPPPKSNPILVPRGRTGEKKRSTTDRKKHPRLNGADLYVVRLGWQTGSGGGAVPCCDTLEQPKDFPAKQATGSLHEELLNAGPVAAPAVNVKVTSKSSKPEPTVLASRPCYRCVSYMDSVGIKRVFWTNSSGEWECAKVRDLVDALDDLGSGGVDAQTTLSSVFVTKHEVLMLRRSMGVEF